MKLTDIMFDLGYIAANTSAEWDTKGDIFNTETLTADANGKLTLAYAPVAVANNGKAYLYYRLASDGEAEYKKVVADGKEVSGFTANATYCVMYRYTNDTAESITISSQFIPETLHAILTVALYAGDSCNAETASKVGEVTIDIPRFQLSGAMDITMSATGAAQSSLEGNALASGCTGCDGKAVYATITKVIYNAKWYDNVDEIIVEEADEDSTPAVIDVGVNSTTQLHIYAAMRHGAPRELSADDVVVTFDVGEKVSLNDNLVLSANASASAGDKVGMKVVLKESKDDSNPVFANYVVEVVA